MNPSPPHCVDPERLGALRRYGILDTPRETDFDDIVRLAAQICGTPVATISFVDGHRQWFKSEVGLGLTETALSNSICQRAILEDETLVVPDTLQDPRFCTMEICVGEPFLRFYAGAVIRTEDGHALGTICVLDYQPREITPEQLNALRILARQVLTMLELRRRAHDEHLAGRALERGEQRYRAVLQATTDVIWTNSAEGKMCGEQAGWSRFTGQTFEEYQGFGWSQAVHPDDAQPTIDAWRHSVETKGRFEIQHRVRRHDGEWRHCLVRAIPMLEGGEVREWVGVHADITDVKRAEVQLRGALHAATEANSAKDEFLAKLSHELRTPLTPVLMTLGELLEEADLPARHRDALTLIFRNVEMEARLIDDLLDVTRIVHGKLELQEESCDVHRLLDHALTICGPALQRRKITAELHLDAAAHFVTGDATRLQQVFWNLLTNAGKFANECGTIRITSTNPEPGRLRVEIADDGLGIEPALIPSLFQVFEQGPRTITRRFGGLGLGLAICKGVVDLHGGTIVAQSAGLGEGTTMTVELPRASAPAAAPRGVGLTGRADGPAKAPPLRILLVEDHESTAEVLARLLRRAGHDVQHADTIAAARERAEEYPFDLVVSDLGLPDGSGLELMRELRDSRGLQGLALSGYGTPSDIADCREAGFLQHLLKPVEWKHLDAALRDFAASRAPRD